MTIISETNLTNFKWWSGALTNSKKLTYEELEQLENELDAIYPDGIKETELNDIMWFDFKWVCELIGLEYDANEDEIKREE